MRIGAHMSVAGGLPNAVERAVLHGCESLQIFAKNASQWRGRSLDADEIRRFRTRVEETGITPVVSHASYLINLATTSPTLRDQSIAAFVDELDRATALGLLGVVIHPGTCTAGTEEDGLRLIAEAIAASFAARPGQTTMVLLEHTAGQGRTLGHRFEHLRAIIEYLDGSPRVGVCLDTCHLVAAGYDIVSDDGYAQTFASFDRLVGFDRLKAFHGNDSKKPCGSRVDRHEHIGKGCIGVEPFRRLLTDARFAGLPMLIETAKAEGPSRPNVIAKDPLDARNLRTLRSLRDSRTSMRGAAPRPRSAVRTRTIDNARSRLHRRP
jgi:deoxyribonuclease-4